MKKLTKHQILIILLIVCCSIAFAYLIISSIHSLVEACDYLTTYSHLLEEPGLVEGLSQESIALTISQLKISIVRICLSIISFTVLFSTSLILLVLKFRKSRIKNRIDPPTI